MRSRGYAFDKKNDEEYSFVRRISGQEFPRFHAYVKIATSSPTAPPRNDEKDLIINLHLDQKRPSYETGPAHSGEYDGELVKEEIRRLEHN